MDRLPFFITRWKGRISIAVYLQENDLHTLEEDMNRIAFHRNITFIFYIRRIRGSETPSVFTWQNKTIMYPNGIYPMNILRDLSIESITTSHYVLLDVDTFISSTLESNIQRNQRLLCNHYNVLLLPLFEMVNSNAVMKCRQDGMCNDVLMSNHIPYN